MEERKLTDEEWFEAYAKRCKALEDGYCEQLAYGGTSDAQTEKEIEFDRRLIAYVHRLQDENAEQKAEIEQLNDEANEDTITHIDLCTENLSLRKQNAELQRQVDELKDICLDCPYKLKFDEIEKQAVKDTAKVIYNEIGDNDILVITTQEYGSIEVVPLERLQEIIKSKGVEVE